MLRDPATAPFVFRHVTGTAIVATNCVGSTPVQYNMHGFWPDTY